MEKYKGRELKRQIGGILWTVWDPIGLNTVPEARDEYDPYINPIFDLLMQDASDEELAAYLLKQIADTMGLSGATREHMLATVKALRELKINRSDKDPSLRSGL